MPQADFRSTKYGKVRVLLPEGVTPPTDDEPVFILRGQDSFAPAAIRAYVHICMNAGLEEQAVACEDALHDFEAWQEAHHTLKKNPTPLPQKKDEEE